MPDLGAGQIESCQVQVRSLQIAKAGILQPCQKRSGGGAKIQNSRAGSDVLLDQPSQARVRAWSASAMPSLVLLHRTPQQATHRVFPLFWWSPLRHRSISDKSRAAVI